jgi:hypothetical protein
MRRTIIGTLVALVAWAGLPTWSAQAQAGCDFKLGFRTIRDQIVENEGRDVVGSCLENERFEPSTGNSQQRTSGGLLVWRKADNWTAFTDGATTWLNGPEGLVSRPNAGPLFPWEAVVPPPPPPAPVQPVAPQAAPPARLPRQPAHRYLLGAHELPNAQLIEKNNEYQEMASASIARREFYGADFGMGFVVFVHDTAEGAALWMWESGRQIQERSTRCGELMLEQAGSPDEGWVCQASSEGSTAIAYGVRVENRAAMVVVAGSDSAELASLARASVRFQVERLRALPG